MIAAENFLIITGFHQKLLISIQPIILQISFLYQYSSHFPPLSLSRSLSIYIYIYIYIYISIYIYIYITVPLSPLPSPLCLCLSLSLSAGPLD